MTRLWMTMIVAFAALGGSGCIVTTDDDLLDYEPCTFDSDCDSFLCEEVRADWGDRVTTDRICTDTCTFDSDCSFTASGLRGTCEDLGRGFLCYETCDFDDDCAGGFRCGDIGGGLDVCLPY